ncbi:probable uridine nucleosidase 2 isoform X2 [Lycium barbarum]|uniref:probable uridine nucleosidase 2 isoform X2 n=1 Tax=Lycium barbarum TaxID=112863 RepID=UPI00293E5667|nr:probable uridine nucleosidase 2 isoform X2 [Lycium barbarum]
MAAERKKVIIDTDPGIDDAIAIFVAFQSPEIEVIGLTTIFGNVHTTLATRNALHLLEVAEKSDIPVAEGSHITITEGAKLQSTGHVHGTDGLGNQNIHPPKGKPIEQTAAEFLIQQARIYPGKVTVVALGPPTNIALAIQLDPEFFKNIGQIVVLGGAFAVNGNVNPAAEANIFKDPTAADIVFTSGADVLVVGLNITHQVVLTGVFLHDPTALLAAVNPSVFTYSEGVVRVQTVGITKGLTIFYNKKKRFAEVTEWSDEPSIKVAVTVDAPKVLKLVMERLLNS